MNLEPEENRNSKHRSKAKKYGSFLTRRKQNRQKVSELKENKRKKYAKPDYHHSLIALLSIATITANKTNKKRTLL